MRHLVFGLVMALLLSSSSALASQSSTMAFVSDSATNTVLPVNVASGVAPVAISVGGAPFGVAVLPDGSRVYVSNRGFSTRFNSTVSVIAVADGLVKTTITVGKMPMGVAADPSGSRVYVANNFSHSLSVIDTASDTVLKTVSLTIDTSGPFFPRGVAVNPNPAMPFVYVTNRGSDDLAIVNTTDWSVARVGIGIDPYGVAVAKDGKTVYVALEGDGKLALVDAVSLQVVSKFEAGPVGFNSGPTGVAVGRDGKVYVTNTASNSVWVVDPANVDPTKRSVPVGVGGKPVGVSVSPDGSRVYVANSTGASLSVIGTASNLVVETIELSGSSPIAFGNYVWGPTAILVAIDIKPGGNPNTINLRSHGTVPVAILSSLQTDTLPEFDATQVDPQTLTLAGVHVKMRGSNKNKMPMAAFEDVNGDGLLDLVVHFDTDELKLKELDTEAVIEGQTFGGDAFRGTDTIKVIP